MNPSKLSETQEPIKIMHLGIQGIKILIFSNHFKI